MTGERRQAVSVTIENSYDDWCAAQLARALGKTKDAAYFTGWRTITRTSSIRRSILWPRRAPTANGWNPSIRNLAEDRAGATISRKWIRGFTPSPCSTTWPD